MNDAYALNYALSTDQLKPEERKKAEAELLRIADLIAKDQESLREIAPYSVRVDANQTGRGSKFLVKLGNFLSGNSAKIASPISDALNPEKRAAADESDIQKVEGLRINAITEASNLAKAIDAKDATAERIARIKLGATCRQIEAAGYSEAACMVIL